MKQNKEMALIVSVLSCCFILITAISFYEPVIKLFDHIGVIADLDANTIQILIKAVGIGILSEVICALCIDAGNAAVGKTLQFLSSAVILWMTIPLINELLDLIAEIIGAL